jgi:AbrB family looped-hinge helix DNA binding protein
MRATGILRRMDDLGRVVIPKEIRRMIKLKEGDAFEIYVDPQREEIIFKRYQFEPILDKAEIFREILQDDLTCADWEAVKPHIDEILKIINERE